MSEAKFGVAGTEEWLEVSSVDYGESYEWDEAHVFYNPADKMFYWASGSGCSCNWINDDYHSISDFGVGNRKQAIQFMQDYVSDSYRGQEIDRQREADRIRNFKA